MTETMENLNTNEAPQTEVSEPKELLALDYTLSKESYRESQRCLCHSLVVAYYAYGIFALLALISGLVLNFCFAVSDGLVLIVMGVILLIFSVIGLVLLRNRITKTYDQSVNIFGCQLHTVFYEDNFKITSEKASNELTYSVITKLIQLPHSLLVYVGAKKKKQNAFIVTTEAMDEATINELHTLLSTKCGKTVIKK